MELIIPVASSVSSQSKPLLWSMDISSNGDEYSLVYFIKIKRPADLSIVERLGGFLCCKDMTFIWVVQEFGKKSYDLTGVFNSCWVLGLAKCSIYKPKWDNWRTKHGQRWACSIYAMQGGRRRKSDYKPDWAIWSIGCNFASSFYRQVRGRAAKWMLAFTKFYCMERGQGTVPCPSLRCFDTPKRIILHHPN